MYIILYNEFIKSNYGRKLPAECLEKIKIKLAEMNKISYKAFIF